MIYAVDTNLLFDVISFGSQFVSESRARLHAARQRGALIICEVVYTELASRLQDERAVQRFLHDAVIRVVRTDFAAMVQAGVGWRTYTSRRPEGIACAACGKNQVPACEQCGESLRARQHLIADFLIGAHASAQADALLTRDRRYFKTYFPALALL